MVSVAAFQPDDLLRIDPHSGKECCSLEYGERLAALGPAYTIRDGETILLCGGIAADPASGESWLWSFIAKSARRRMLALDRAARRFMQVHGGDLMASTPRTFGPGCRWLSMLGFHAVGESQIGGEQHTIFRRPA
jgi:hypothetical protein